MKKSIFAAAALVVLAGAASANAGVNFSVSVGIPAPVEVASYPVAAPVVVRQSPQFIYSPDLGYYVSVGAPYDMAYVDNCYYRQSGGTWYLARTYGGPWSPVPVYRVPHLLRQHPYQEVRVYRDREYGHYLRDRDHYRGNWFRPVVGPGEERREWYRGDDRRNSPDRGHDNWGRR